MDVEITTSDPTLTADHIRAALELCGYFVGVVTVIYRP